MATTVTGTIITGMLPLATSYTRRHRSSGHVTSISASDMTALLRPKVEAAISRDSGTFLSGGLTLESFASYNCRVSGVPLPPIPDRFINLPKLSANNGKAWRQRQRTREIIVSDYTTAQYNISYSYGRETITNGLATSIGKGTWTCGLWPYNPKNNWIIIDDFEYNVTSFSLRAYTNRTLTISKNPYNSGWDDVLWEDILFKTILSQEQDPSLITSSLADANSLTLDALTAMAEMPETIRSIYNAIMTCMKLYVDARRKSLRLYNKAKGNNDRATAVKNAEELASAVADVWLNYRYNIMPNVYLIEDSIKLLQEKDESFFRSRDTQQKDLVWTRNMPGWEHTPRGAVTHRSFIKRRVALSESKFERYTSRMLMNVVVTGYELIPFSFVIDWFVNIGDNLAAHLSSPNFEQEGATYSTSSDLDIQSVLSSDKTIKTDTNIRFYNRKVINPRDTVCISFKPNISTARQLDAVALTWSIFKKDFVKLLNLVMFSKK